MDFGTTERHATWLNVHDKPGYGECYSAFSMLILVQDRYGNDRMEYFPLL